ncbi:MAG: hypothetical protein IJO53_07955, partial [Clostridia bacterium]|nr:hypothetical protein [Clostridia bacterium]
MTLFGIRVRIRLLSPIFFLLMIAFSGASAVFPPLTALAVHEFSHLICAVCLKTHIDEIELMPFGAAIRLYALWEIAPARLMSDASLLVSRADATLLVLQPRKMPLKALLR